MTLSQPFSPWLILKYVGEHDEPFPVQMHPSLTDWAQCVIGNTSALNHHLTGLLELAELRGGLDQLGMSGLLARLIHLSVLWF